MTEFNGPEQILENVPLRLNPDRICKGLRIRSSEDRSRIEALIETSKSLIVARAAYRVCYIETKLENTVVIDGVPLSSSILRKNLEEPWRVFPYIVTIGDELDIMAKTFDDLLERYWLDFIGNAALRSAQESLRNLLSARYGVERMSRMNPGSLDDWPLEEQRPLFSLLGAAADAIRVTLMDSLVMRPSKSLSGLFFPSEVLFFSCQLCRRENCIGRRAKYSKELAEEYNISK
jgi:hypothetical protein